MFGGGGSITAAGDQAFSDARMVLNIIGLLTDREGVAAQIKELADAMKEHRTIRAEIARREEAVLHREKQAAAHEATLAKRAADLSEREAAAKAELQGIEAKREELAGLKRELRQMVAA
jgi:hypothetical protein